MSIADKLATIAENQQKVYDAGYAAGQATVEIGYMDYVRGYTNLFNGAVFPNDTDIVLPVNSGHLTDFSGMFSSISGARSIKLSGGDNIVCTITNIFSNSKLETVDISELNIKFGNSINVFLNQTVLASIIGEIDMSNCTNTLNFFTNCKNLVDVRLKPETLLISLSVGYSPLLSDESIQSILGALADLTGSDTQTITFHATVGAKLTEAQKAAITAKNWTLAY